MQPNAKKTPTVYSLLFSIHYSCCWILKMPRIARVKVMLEYAKLSPGRLPADLLAVDRHSRISKAMFSDDCGFRGLSIALRLSSIILIVMLVQQVCFFHILLNASMQQPPASEEIWPMEGCIASCLGGMCWASATAAAEESCHQRGRTQCWFGEAGQIQEGH